MTKKVVKKQKYTITIEEYEDGSSGMHRKTQGLWGFELLGVLDFISKDIVSIIRDGQTEPTGSIEQKSIKTQ